MSGELTPAEVEGLVRELNFLGAHVTDTVERIGGKLGGYVEWLQQQVAERDRRIEELEDDLASIESERMRETPEYRLVEDLQSAIADACLCEHEACRAPLRENAAKLADLLGAPARLAPEGAAQLRTRIAEAIGRLKLDYRGAEAFTALDHAERIARLSELKPPADAESEG